MEPEILVVAEHDGAEWDPITFELISWGCRIASEKNWKLGVLVLGCAVEDLSETLRTSSVDAIFVLEDPTLRVYNCCLYLNAVEHAIRAIQPRLVLLGHSYFGIEIGGSLAPKLDAALFTNCQSIEASPNGLLVRRAMFRGGFVATLEIDNAAVVLITLQRGTPAFKGASDAAPDIIKLAMPDGCGATRIRVIEETGAAFAEDITKAEIIVAVGRGIGQASRLPAFIELAQALGGAIAASRPIVDIGWLPPDYQVGLSGRTVRPKVYLACGISGSAQHVVGMKDSGLIIAINQDPNAPIFQVAHWGVVGDLSQIVPSLLRIAKEQSRC